MAKKFTTMEEVADFLSTKKMKKERKLRRKWARETIDKFNDRGFTANEGFKNLIKGGLVK